MERIRQLRNEKGLSQAKLAVRADMDPATLNRLEQGKGNPNLKTLERVAEALGVEVAELLGKAQRRSSPEPLLTGLLEEERHPLTDKALDAVRQDEEKDARAMARLNASEGVLQTTAASGYAEDALRAELRMLTFDELFDKAFLPLAQRAYRAEQLLERAIARNESNKAAVVDAYQTFFAEEMAKRNVRQ